MKSKRMLLTASLSVLALSATAAQAQNVEAYNDGSRIDNPLGCAEFCCFSNGDPLQNYEEDGLIVHADNIAFVTALCNMSSQNFYPNAGMTSRVSITRADGGDFGHLELEVADGWGKCDIYVWATAYLDGNPIGDFNVDMVGGSLLGFEGTFDQILIAAYFDIATRDQRLEGNYNAIGLDNVCFDGASADCLTLTVDTLIAGSSADWTVSGATAGEQVAIVYGFSSGSTGVNGFGGYCATFGIQGVNQNKLVCKKSADGAGNATCTKKIPAGVKGRRVLSQAAERNTCPDECVSNLDDQVVG